MNFGAKYVYIYEDSEEECVSEEEYDGGLDSHSSSDDEDVPIATGASSSATASLSADSHEPKKKRSSLVGGLSSLFKRKSATSREEVAAAGSSKTRSKKRRHHWKHRAIPNAYASDEPSRTDGQRWRRADTNVITVKFNQLKTPSNMHTGDPFHCSGCKAVLSKLSKLEQESEDKVWKCEFCNTLNDVDLMDEELPGSDDVTYLMQPAASTLASGPAGSDQSLVVFCMDISGSMCVTTEVPGKVKLRGSHLDRLQSLNDTREPQYLPGQRRDVTLVSRLQSVQAAVDHQLEELSKEYPDRRVCLLTFNSEVTVVGDGSGTPISVAGAKLSNRDELEQIASEIATPGAIKHRRDVLSEKVFDLEEGGMTALGPALLMSICIASKVPSSKVIMCTDGLANVGLGNLDELHSDDVYAQNATFYTDMSNMAAEKGVSVSVFTIKGTKCRLVELGKVAEATGGQVNIVDPLKLTQEFGNILADPIIATNVTATLQIHSGLYLRNEETQDSTVTKFVGNVTKSTEITFEYGVRKNPKKPGAVVYDNVTKTSDKPSEANVTKENSENEAMEMSQAEGDKAGSSETKESPNTHEIAPMDVEPAAVNENAAESSMEMSQTQPESELKPAIQLAQIEIMQAEDENGGSTASGSYSHVPVADTDAAKPKEEPSTSAKISKDALKGANELPFQLQIQYTDLEGAIALRVITQCKPVTRQREQAEENMNMAALGAHAAQTSAQLALRGEYNHSRMNAFMYRRLLHRGHKSKSKGDRTSTEENVYCNYLSNVSNLDKALQRRQISERTTRGRTYSDDEDCCEEPEPRMVKSAGAPSAPAGLRARGMVTAASVPASRSVPMSKQLGKKGWRRRMDLEDDEAEDMYETARVSSSFLKKSPKKKE